MKINSETYQLFKKLTKMIRNLSKRKHYSMKENFLKIYKVLKPLSEWVFTSHVYVIQCSASCGSGVQYREAKCVDMNGAIMADSDCDPDAQVKAQSCNNDPCPTWVAGSWTGVCTDSHYFKAYFLF